ncbi:MAG: metal ABC transporter substrate-binding protein [Firmicutes bacterium HGW-Firmicutes-7]|nr:MAG: metal ABC transporter substrate-binding protein [Firmicutes bacterium HGW-Firmicutes-7]
MKKLIMLMMVGVLILSFTACSEKKSNTVETKKPLIIGLMASEDATPFILAEEKKYLDKYNVLVSYEIFKSAKDRDAAFQAGSLDGIVGDQVAIALYQNADFDVKIASYTDCDFMLIASKESGIKSINDVVGKRVAISEKTVIEYTLDRMLESYDINPEVVIKTLIPAIPTRVEMLNNNKVDLALLPEPFATLALNDGGILLERASNIGLKPSVIAFTQEAIDNKREEITLFFDAYDDAIEYANNTPISEYEDIVINTVGYPEDMKGKVVFPKLEKSGLPSEEALQSAIDWVEAYGLNKKTLTPKDLIIE